VQLPGTSEFKVIICLSESLSAGKVEIEKVSPGFIFSPFSNENGRQSYYLKADIIFSTLSNSLLISSHITSKEQHKLDAFLTKLESETAPDVLSNSAPLAFRESKDYQQLVENGIKLIKDGNYDKLVLSRNKKIQLGNNFAPLEILTKLRAVYENAFCYILSTKEFGNWMAATPETLLSTDESLFETVALAGTAKLDSGQNLNHVSWTQKEIEEQAMVSRYIINSFKKIRLREFKETGPRTVKAGNLAHLKTHFAVNYKEINFPELGSVMLELLHPTSAVCGMPLEGARKFIYQNEGFDRSLFSGFLGPVNIDAKTHIFVNLRTMRFNHSEAVLYAGAGITEDSDPEKEFLETELKMNTLLNVINP